RDAHHPDLHSFPTRRSSDLGAGQISLDHAQHVRFANDSLTSIHGTSAMKDDEGRDGAYSEGLREGRRLVDVDLDDFGAGSDLLRDRKSTRLNSSHVKISYAV